MGPKDPFSCMLAIDIKRHDENIGDKLSVPSNYFHIESDSQTYVLGGGQWEIENSGAMDVERCVAWGIGYSFKYGRMPFRVKIEALPFLEWGFRDRNMLLDKNKFLPCSSCMHPDLFEDPQGNETLYYFNKAQPEVFLGFGKRSQQLHNWCSYKELKDRWSKADTIITNSYHAIYWALLSNRKVVPFGYGSKFEDVMDIFDARFPEQNYYHWNQYKGPRHFDMTPIGVNSNFYLDQFRSINLEFAESLKKYDINVTRKIL